MNLEKVRQVLREEGISAMILTGDDPNFFYAVKERSDGLLIVFKDRQPVLFTRPLEDLRLRGVQVQKTRDMWGRARTLLKGIKEIGVDESHLSISQEKMLKIRKKDIGKSIEEMRMIKSAEELAAIRKACVISCDIMNHLLGKLGSFLHESDTKRFLKIEAIKRGCEPAFEPIVASGLGAGVPHYAREKRLARGFLIIDFGVRYRGYCADMTRTVFLGTPSGKDRALYEKILSCQADAMGFIAKNLGRCTGKEAYDRACAFLGKDRKYFIHGLGHGIGIEVHEEPALSKRGTIPLKKGMVLAIEPGYYKGSGIRIEDTVSFGKKTEVLTRHVSKDLVVYS